MALAPRPRPESLDTGLAPSELDPERPRPIETPWGTMALYRVDDTVLASQAFCPHMGGPLFQGTLSGAEVTCPWHLWRFDLVSGRCLAKHGPHPEPGDARLRRCEVSLSASGTLVLSPLAPS